MTRTHQRSAAALGVAAALLLALDAPANAQSDNDRATRCASWIAKKGYSRDYIEQRTGRRPPARNRWRSNIQAEDLQVGDVVGITLWPGHVALIEEIERDEKSMPIRVKVSSFNYSDGKGWLDKDCDVTVSFGIQSSHWVLMKDTIGSWRPGPKVNTK